MMSDPETGFTVVLVANRSSEQAGSADSFLFPILQLMLSGQQTPAGVQEVGPKAVGIALYGPYLLAVELASMMLTAGLVAAYHLGKHD